MAKHVKAKVCWVPAELGGKKSVPLKYSTAAEFTDLGSGEAWSLNLIFETEVDENRCAIYDVWFLVGEDAPEYLLYSGSLFQLYERNKVADGVVL